MTTPAESLAAQSAHYAAVNDPGTCRPDAGPDDPIGEEEMRYERDKKRSE